MTEQVKPVAVRAPKAKTAKPKAPKEVKSPEQKAAERAEKKAEKEALQKVEFRKERIAFQLKNLRQEFVPEPPAHRTYRKGERVTFGAHPNAVVAEVFDDGKFYLVQTYGTYSEYGRPVERKNEHVVSWLAVQPYREIEVNSTIRTVVRDPEDIHLSMSQRDVSSLLHMYYHAGMNTEPEYQRGLCWDNADNLAYIESVFEGRDLGKFVVVQLDFKGKYCYELLDGKQRLNALRLFYEDRMAYRGKLFSQLAWIDQNKFEGMAIAFGQLTKVTQAQKLKVFLKLNTGGRPQDPVWLKHVQSMLDEETRTNAAKQKGQE
jgi:hypothetical protein